MARYQDAIDWIAGNDDTEWVEQVEAGEPGWSISVTGALVADLFGKTEEQVRKDIKRALARMERQA